MILSLIEKGWFNRPDKTPRESAYLSSYAEAVRLISIENAGN